MTEQAKNVYQLIASVAGELAKVGISKDRKNSQQGFMYRGIDDVYTALAPLLSENGLVILPRCIDRQVCERVGKSGGALFYVTVQAEFDFVSAHDGSKHTVCTYGEAMDSGDKATNKAMSAAYKYAALQAFCIPTEGDNDADAVTHEVTSGLYQLARTAAMAGRDSYISFYSGRPQHEKDYLKQYNSEMRALCEGLASNQALPPPSDTNETTQAH